MFSQIQKQTILVLYGMFLIHMIFYGLQNIYISAIRILTLNPKHFKEPVLISNMTLLPLSIITAAMITETCTQPLNTIHLQPEMQHTYLNALIPLFSFFTFQLYKCSISRGGSFFHALPPFSV